MYTPQDGWTPACHGAVGRPHEGKKKKKVFRAGFFFFFSVPPGGTGWHRGWRASAAHPSMPPTSESPQCRLHGLHGGAQREPLAFLLWGCGTGGTWVACGGWRVAGRAKHAHVPQAGAGCLQPGGGHARAKRNTTPSAAARCPDGARPVRLCLPPLLCTRLHGPYGTAGCLCLALTGGPQLTVRVRRTGRESMAGVRRAGQGQGGHTLGLFRTRLGRNGMPGPVWNVPAPVRFETGLVPDFDLDRRSGFKRARSSPRQQRPQTRFGSGPGRSSSKLARRKKKKKI